MKNLSIKKEFVSHNLFVGDILKHFSDIEEISEYLSYFDYERTEFVLNFLQNVFYNLFVEGGNDKFEVEIEKGVKLIFTHNYPNQEIIMAHYDQRILPIAKYCEYEPRVEPTFEDEYEGFLQSMCAGAPTLRTIKEICVYNKPILHSVKIKFKIEKYKEVLDIERTFKNFVHEFIIFANIIDIEHEDVLIAIDKIKSNKPRKIWD